MNTLLAQVSDGIDAATEGLTDEQMAWRPPGKWSAAEILEHLERTYQSTATRLSKALASGELRLTPATWRQRVARWVVVGVGYMPSGRAAPEFALPAGMAPRQALEQVRESLTKMDGALEECERRFGPGKLTNHFAFGPLSAQEWRRFHWVHGRHHLRQIAARRARIGMPR